MPPARKIMTNPPKHKLRWYQYKLSSLFVLTALVAIACSWYATVMHNAAKRRKAIAEIEKLDGGVRYYNASSPNSLGEPPRWYSWLRKLHGDEHLGNAVFIALVGPQITDAGLEHLKGLTNLESLILEDTQITGVGLVHLKGLTNLEALWLRGTQITDAGLVHLKGLPKLESLILEGTQVTEEGVMKLEEALPNCKIVHSLLHSGPMLQSGPRGAKRREDTTEKP